MNNINELLKSGALNIKKIENLKKMSIIILICSIIGFILSFRTIGSNIFYYDATSNNIRLEANFMTSPVINRETVINNAQQAINETFNFNSINYENVLDQATNKWYTNSGTNSLFNELFTPTNNQNSLIERIETNRITLQSTVVPGTMTIISANRINGKIALQLGAEVLFTYRNRFGIGNSEQRDVTLWMVERDTTKYPIGIGIDSIRIL